MKNTSETSRRTFLAKAAKGAVFFGAGATFINTMLSPLSTLAQTTDNKSEAELRAKVLALGTASLQTSQLALSKASNAKVKMFAKFEAAEQETMGRILKEMGTAPAPLPEGKEMLAKLQQLSGAAFDKAFMQGQVQTHQKLFAAVSALKGAGDTHTKHLTSLALTTIQEHTERGQKLLAELA